MKRSVKLLIALVLAVVQTVFVVAMLTLALWCARGLSATTQVEVAVACGVILVAANAYQLYKKL